MLNRWWLKCLSICCIGHTFCAHRFYSAQPLSNWRQLKSMLLQGRVDFLKYEHKLNPCLLNVSPHVSSIWQLNKAIGLFRNHFMKFVDVGHFSWTSLSNTSAYFTWIDCWETERITKLMNTKKIIGYHYPDHWSWALTWVGSGMVKSMASSNPYTINI